MTPSGKLEAGGQVAQLQAEEVSGNDPVTQLTNLNLLE